MAEPVIVAALVLQAYVAGLYEAAGVRAADAALVARVQVMADLRGVETHGVVRAPVYLERIRKGALNPRPNLTVSETAPAAVLVDGDHGLGAVTATRAMDEAMARARTHGIGCAAVKHGAHFGMAAAYVLQAIEAGMIGMVFTNASPALPPWGGRRPFFGTSPMAVGVPGGAAGPFVLDMAMSVLARGNVYIAAQRGTPIPEGLALDKEGRPTTDPQALLDGGTMLPAGGVKGAALSFLMDILGGVLTGAAFAGKVGNPHYDMDRMQDAGHLMIALKPDLFMPMEAFRARMDLLMAAVKAEPRMAGVDEIFAPGEREARRLEERLKGGIPLPPELAAALRAEGPGAPF